METKKTTPGSLPTRSARRERESILVVDQDPRVLELLQITLSGRGYTVYTAGDGEAVLTAVEEKAPDLLVLGVRLARLGGFQVLEALRTREATARLPIILIAGNPSPEARIQALRLGADDYLTKPFSPRELILKIRTILDRVADLRILRARNRTLEREAHEQRTSTLQARQEMDAYLDRIGTLLAHLEETGRDPSPESVHAGLARIARRDLGLSSACVLCPRDGTLQLVASDGVLPAAAAGLQLQLDGLLGDAVGRAGRTVMIDELTRFPRAGEALAQLAVAGVTHLTPITSEAGELIALLAGSERHDGQGLAAFDRHLLGVLARGAALALSQVAAHAETREAFVVTTAQLIATVEQRHPELQGHSARVAELALRIGERSGATPGELTLIGQVARLHDLGGLEEYAHLLEESRQLTDAERDALRRRRCAGIHHLLGHVQLSEVARGIYYLNERWDGSGVPDGLVAEGIPVAARVVAVANAYDALTHARPHRPAYAPEEALHILQARAGTQFEPGLIRALVDGGLPETPPLAGPSAGRPSDDAHGSGLGRGAPA